MSTASSPRTASSSSSSSIAALAADEDIPLQITPLPPQPYIDSSLFTTAMASPTAASRSAATGVSTPTPSTSSSSSSSPSFVPHSSSSHLLDDASSSFVTLKVQCGDQTRRFRVASQITFVQLHEELIEVCKLSPSCEFVIKYKLGDVTILMLNDQDVRLAFGQVPDATKPVRLTIEWMVNRSSGSSSAAAKMRSPVPSTTISNASSASSSSSSSLASSMFAIAPLATVKSPVTSPEPLGAVPPQAAASIAPSSSAPTTATVSSSTPTTAVNNEVSDQPIQPAPATATPTVTSDGAPNSTQVPASTSSAHVGPPEGSFIFEYAKSGRSKCRFCHQLIANAEVRIGQMISVPVFDGLIPYWYHRACALSTFEHEQLVIELLQQSNALRPSDFDALMNLLTAPAPPSSSSVSSVVSNSSAAASPQAPASASAPAPASSSEVVNSPQPFIDQSLLTPVKTASNASFWTCAACTFENPSKAFNCELCASVGPTTCVAPLALPSPAVLAPPVFPPASPSSLSVAAAVVASPIPTFTDVELIPALLPRLRVAELKHALASRGLDVHGIKSELVARLQVYLAAKQSSGAPVAPSSSSSVTSIESAPTNMSTPVVVVPASSSSSASVVAPPDFIALSEKIAQMSATLQSLTSVMSPSAAAVPLIVPTTPIAAAVATDLSMSTSMMSISGSTVTSPQQASLELAVSTLASTVTHLAAEQRRMFEALQKNQRRDSKSRTWTKPRRSSSSLHGSRLSSSRSRSSSSATSSPSASVHCSAHASPNQEPAVASPASSVALHTTDSLALPGVAPAASTDSSSAGTSPMIIASSTVSPMLDYVNLNSVLINSIDLRELDMTSMQSSTLMDGSALIEEEPVTAAAVASVVPEVVIPPISESELLPFAPPALYSIMSVGDAELVEEGDVVIPSVEPPAAIPIVGVSPIVVDVTSSASTLTSSFASPRSTSVTPVSEALAASATSSSVVVSSPSSSIATAVIPAPAAADLISSFCDVSAAPPSNVGDSHDADALRESYLNQLSDLGYTNRVFAATLLNMNLNNFEETKRQLAEFYAHK